MITTANYQDFLEQQSRTEVGNPNSHATLAAQGKSIANTLSTLLSKARSFVARSGFTKAPGLSG
jgi:hypothetical protein